MIAVVIGVALFMTVSQADEKCKGGNINQHLCQKTCNLTSCSCDMTDISPFTSCAQKCHFFSSCPKMICSGRHGCSQRCFFGHCNMECSSSQFCSQSCVWRANCVQITCSSAICHQVCANCTMECTSGVERCDQMCLGGRCEMKCQAKHCKRQCFKGRCNYIGRSQSKASVLQSETLAVLIACVRLLCS
ncbi:keratin-associated protein 5-5-like [Orbicella faveolata]|uniref:keratin-associated protein 5-5-like n=1 Tax=Orbicella faveolata TaxID=48498 RepID=UPI0009E463F9|nr:keratin-associated protein 5-5-like [Orbicella faveolata]